MCELESITRAMQPDMSLRYLSLIIFCQLIPVAVLSASGV